MKRPYGSGSLTMTDANARGERSWVGQWRAPDGTKVKRRLGTVRQEGSKAGLTATSAERLLRARMAEPVQLTARARANGMTFADADEQYRRHLVRQGRKRTTVTAVESCMRVWVIPFFGDKPMASVTWREIEDLVALMEDKPLSPKSIANYVGTISALYSYGLSPKRKWSTANPVDGVELPAVVQSTEIRFLTLEEVDALIRAVPAGRFQALDRVLYLVAAMTGLREGELVALPWLSVDWPTARIRVRRNYTLGAFDTPKSRRGSRAVPLSDEVAKALAAWQPRDAGDEDLVFADPVAGGPISNAAIMRRMRRALKAAGLPESHVFHDLRHTFGTRMAAAGVPMRTLQEWMGHRDIQTTMRYADYAPSAHEAQMVNAAFSRAPDVDSADVQRQRRCERAIASARPTVLEAQAPSPLIAGRLIRSGR